MSVQVASYHAPNFHSITSLRDGQVTAQAVQSINLPPLAPTAPVIAIDLDDVLSGTNDLVIRWHNETYGTDMDLSEAYYYCYSKNPHWGSTATTRTKVKRFYGSHKLGEALPVPGAREGVYALRTLGFRLVIVTARGTDAYADGWVWVQRWFPGCFDSMTCVGQVLSNGSPKRVTKAEVCIDLGAKLLIDDSMDNALACARYLAPDGVAKVPPPVLLFGTYEWNKRMSQPGDESDDMVFDVRVEREGGTQFLEEDAKKAAQLLESVNATRACVLRASDWNEVVRYIVAAQKEGKI
ncbi:hypothetical protein PAXRUDRAFT_822402 [Paxillus rubicundulus Ve08.2h10]|uniref:Uncharacterized protein n=1 Tax=Paxillus rubicundulus Ve08.2h10 TaxID=930991 RepID=A0A0D0ECQ6_9AGAM|nr:hypothetical protein PAXRUDRAFT_822402 [Paxillus rubicundulus Ve08.2h10]